MEEEEKEGTLSGADSGDGLGRDSAQGGRRNRVSDPDRLVHQAMVAELGGDDTRGCWGSMVVRVRIFCVVLEQVTLRYFATPEPKDL